MEANTATGERAGLVVAPDQWVVGYMDREVFNADPEKFRRGVELPQVRVLCVFPSGYEESALLVHKTHAALRWHHPSQLTDESCLWVVGYRRGRSTRLVVRDWSERCSVSRGADLVREFKSEEAAR